MHIICIFAEIICELLIVSLADANYFPTFYWDTGSSEWLYLFATSCNYCIQLLPTTIESFDSTLFMDIDGVRLNNSISNIDELQCYENDTYSLSFASRKCRLDSKCESYQYFMYSLNSHANSASNIIHCTIGYSLSANNYYRRQAQNLSSSAYYNSTYGLYLVTTLNMTINIIDDINDTNTGQDHDDIRFLNTYYYESSTNLFDDKDSSYVYEHAPLLRDVCYFAQFRTSEFQQFDSIDSINPDYYDYDYWLLAANSMIISYSNNYDVDDYSTFYWYTEPPYCDLSILNTTQDIPFQDRFLYIDEKKIRIHCDWMVTVCLHKPLPYFINSNTSYTSSRSDLLSSWYESAIVDDLTEFDIYYSGFNKNNYNNYNNIEEDMNIWSEYELSYGFYRGKFYKEVKGKRFDNDKKFEKYIKMKSGVYYWNTYHYRFNIFLWNLSDMNTLLCFVISFQILNASLIYGFCTNVCMYLKYTRMYTDDNNNNSDNNNSNDNNDNNDGNNNNNNNNENVEKFGSTMGQLYLLLFCLWFPWFIIAYLISVRSYDSVVGNYSGDHEVEAGNATLFDEMLYFNRFYLRDYVGWTVFVFPSIIFILRLISVKKKRYDCIHYYTKLKDDYENSNNSTANKKSFKLQCVKFCCDCQYCVEKKKKKRLFSQRE